MSLERVEDALWSVFRDLREGDITEEESEALTGVLDSLLHCHEIRHKNAQLERRTAALKHEQPTP